MLATIHHGSKSFQVNLAEPLDISIPVTKDRTGVRAWYREAARIFPYQEDNFIGSVAHGAAVNFNDIAFNPHAHVTHTESVGHITKEFNSVNELLKTYFFTAELITVAPERLDSDFVISEKQLKYALGKKKCEALIIRTLPNTKEKVNKNYSNTNPPYLSEAAAQFLVAKNILHLLIDLPSVDREKDEGKLIAHKTFWNVDGSIRYNATITELVYVEDAIKDGSYLLNLQVAPFENDAAPSRPILFRIQ